MITHDTFIVEIELGSMIVYSVYEKPTKFDILEEKRFYWHDKTCAESIGPFQDLASAMEDYASVKRVEKTLQRKKRVQELQGKVGGT